MSWNYICWGLYYYCRGLSICMNSGRGWGGATARPVDGSLAAADRSESSTRPIGRWLQPSGVYKPSSVHVATRVYTRWPMRPVAVAISTQLVFDFLYFFIFRVLLIISSAADFELVTKDPEFFY